MRSSDWSSDFCSSDLGDTRSAEQDPAYRRALWLVILLNLGLGLVQLVGGFIADSQALKADSLDFLGDGSISFVGLLALAWGARARALAALTHGLFLGPRGIGGLRFAVLCSLNPTLPTRRNQGKA